MAGGANQEKPISLFYSYSHRDEKLRKKLEDQLAGLRWSGKITEWHDRNIDVGDEWAKEIDRNLTLADIILLLVSASFIASKYCWSIEMKKALERHNKGEAKVIPVILRPCSWHTAPFAKLQAAPTDAKPVTSWSDPDEALYEVARQIEREVTDLQQRRRTAEQAQDFAVFRDIDAPWCPEMVALPVGEFLMGSGREEKGHSDEEGPQHPVKIEYRFAIGRYPITFHEYDHFYEVSNGDWEKPDDNCWGRGRRPVINVNWIEAKAYVEWLAKETGKPYRLPTEAEWEYACRAGTKTRYWCGYRITENDAKFGGGKTREVGSYSPNPWGLYDMHGNVSEWVEDIWHKNYKGAPANGRAWLQGGDDEDQRVLRGGSWLNNEWVLRSAFRHSNRLYIREDSVGFRVARTLD